jgi:hypothetical protein
VRRGQRDGRQPGLHAALIASSRRETGSAPAVINAISHWAFGDVDARRDGFDWKHTMTGAMTQQAASVFWALVYERFEEKGGR